MRNQMIVICLRFAILLLMNLMGFVILKFNTATMKMIPNGRKLGRESKCKRSYLFDMYYERMHSTYSFIIKFVFLFFPMFWHLQTFFHVKVLTIFKAFAAKFVLKNVIRKLKPKFLRFIFLM